MIRTWTVCAPLFSSSPTCRRAAGGAPSCGWPTARMDDFFAWLSGGRSSRSSGRPTALSTRSFYAAKDISRNLPL